MKPGAEREGSIPSCSYDQSHLAGLKGSAAWLWLPAAAMAASLGVTLGATLPAAASPSYTLQPSSGRTVNLSNGAYGGATSFIINPGTTISNVYNAIVAGGSTAWNLNNAGHVASSGYYGVAFTGTQATLTNSGTISGGYSAVYLAAGVLTNSGTSAQLNGLYGGVRATGSVTIVNEGAISGAAIYGIFLGGGPGVTSSVTNSGADSLISGPVGIRALAVATIVNEGTILGGPGANGRGMYLEFGGSVTNGGTGFATALIEGFTGIHSRGAVDILNAGMITGSGGDSIYLSGGSVTNSGTGSLISGVSTGVHAVNSATIFNEGSITGANNSGISLGNGGRVTNSGTGSSIVGGSYGIHAYGATTIVNQGVINGHGNDGIYLSGGGSVTNSGTDSYISGHRYGINSGGGALTVLNEGSIVGTNAYGILANHISPASLNLTNSGTSSYINGVESFGATTIVNEGQIFNPNGPGVFVYGGAGDTTLITNSANALISGDADGIHLVNAGTIINSGIIQGGVSGSSGVFLDAGGSVTNSGTGSQISGHYYGINSNSGALTVVNEGSIFGGTYGVVSGSLNLTNSGTSSYIIGVRSFGATTIVNEGRILGLNGTDAVYVNAGAGVSSLITNRANAVIDGTSSGAGIHLLSDGTIINDGIIQGGTCSCTIGVFLEAGGSVTNGGTANTAASITGGGFGVRIQGGAGQVTNFGAISSSNNVAVAIYGGGAVTNSGYIHGYSDAVSVQGGGSVTNLAGGLIASNNNSGVNGAYGNLSVINHGTIVGFYGVNLYNGGGGTPGVYTNAYTNRLTNSGTASLIGGFVGVFLTGNNTVVNEGTIAGFGPVAVQLVGNSSFTNQGATSLVQGFYSGITAIGQGQVINQGTITAVYPVTFRDPLYGAPSNNTLTNAGAITSLNGAGGVAVQFGAGNDRLILVQGYSFTGTVQGGAGTNTLEVFSGPASFAMLDGTEFVDFTQLQVDAGATLTFTGPPTIPAGVGFINAGGFTNTGTLTVHGTFTNIGTFTNSGSVIGDINGIINSGGVLTNTGTITGTANDGVVLTGGTLNNTGVVQGGKYGVVVGAGAQVNNSGTILDDAIAGASLGSGASLTNNAGSTLSGVTGVVFTGTGASLTNMGTITGSGGVAIQFDAGSNSATLSTGSVLNGSIDGGGGAGQIVLSGTNTQTNTIANFGAGSGLTVAAGASWTASGNWTIANVTNGGTLQPGTAAAPLKLTGNFTQTGAGTFKALLGGTGAQLQVTGTAALGGTVLVIPPDTVLAPTKYTLVAATGGVTGTFSGVTGGTALLGTDLSYDANDAFLTISQRAVTSPIGVTETPNQLAVAGGFNAGLLANPTAFSAPLALLNQLQAPAFIKALDQMSGENLVDVSTAALLAQRQFIGQVMRQSRLTHGSDQEWSLWASGYGESGHLNGDGNAHRFNGGVSGAAAGADYRVSPALRLGAAAGIGISHFNVAGANGTGRVAYKQIAGTASYDGGPFYVDAMLGGEFGEGTTRRDIVLPGLVSSAVGKINSSQVMGSFEVGYGMSLEETISMTPFARLETGEVDQDAFSETGAGILNLAAPAQSTSSTESLLGARFGTGMPIGAMLVDADFTLGWRHQLAGRGRTGRLSFAGVAGTDFTIAGASLLGDAAELGLGLSTPISDTGAAWIHYDSDYASNGSSQAITVGLRFAW